ncbi:MAG TPA: hypothetical protein VFG21_08705 [Xanthomonadaceae bacterium]|nr:hypothetical protein [Xanthomonadaceae bacterium]
MAVAISLTAFTGFAFTYFGPVLRGAYPAVSPMIHVHGWSFFAWYLLLPLQALLMTAGRRRIHMTLGSASVVLAIVMVFTGILVASVRIEQGLSAQDPDELTAFWKEFGQLIMFNMLPFVVFYTTAIVRRSRADVHKRLIIMASASALPAAIFRIIVGFGGFYWLATPAWVMPTAFLLPAVFIVVGMVRDRITDGSIHRTYLVGLPFLLVVHGLGLIIVGTPVGEAVSRIMAVFARVFGAHV